MNFMSGRSGFCEDITVSRATDSSPPSPNFNFRALPPPPPESSPANNGGDDSDDHMRQEDGGGSSRSAVVEREHMFDKVVTPSDVGKLNRLVIPKQHAEKYFPLDSSSNEKGLLLNFEDRTGKPWRFRYSYWNSSQSYVMTKGWSRFVKEKKLDAGDVVSFQRGVGDSAKDRLFIDWRHRPDVPDIPQFSFHRSSIHPWSPLFVQPPTSAAFPSPYHHHALTNYIPNYAYPYNATVVNGNPCPPPSIMYFRSTPGVSSAIGQIRGSGDAQMVFNAVPVVQGKAAAKRLRLFGVNMDCPISDESDGCDVRLSSTTITTNTTATQPQPTMPLHHLLQYNDSDSPSTSFSIRRPNRSDDDNKGKGSMSLDLDI